MSSLARLARKLIAGIGNKGRAGIGNERERFTGGEPRHELRPRERGIMLVIGRERRRDTIMFEQLARHSRILAGDDVGSGQDAECA